jgi:hypothetical protein
VNEYWSEVRGKRFEKITKLMKESNSLNLIISYDSTFSEKLISEFIGESVGEPWYSVNNRAKYQLYKIKLSDRSIYLLPTPYFGQGWMDYLDIPKAIDNIRKYLTH